MSEYKSLCERLNDEITRLRAENEKLLSALGNFASKKPVQLTCDGGGFIQVLVVFDSDLSAARAALEGVTEKSGAGNE